MLQEIVCTPTIDEDYFGECGYYVMHWMSTIILGTLRNNWEAVSLFQTKSIYL